MKKITVTTATSLVEIAQNKCRNCNHINICVQVMREHCANEILKEQKIINQ
jgi:hypothetical protein